MHYKTMILELLRQQPAFYRQLRQDQAVLPALDRYARELKASHEAWMGQLCQTKPGSDPLQVKSQALEIALRELRGPPGVPTLLRPNPSRFRSTRR